MKSPIQTDDPQSVNPRSGMTNPQSPDKARAETEGARANREHAPATSPPPSKPASNPPPSKASGWPSSASTTIGEKSLGMMPNPERTAAEIVKQRIGPHGAEKTNPEAQAAEAKREKADARSEEQSNPTRIGTDPSIPTTAEDRVSAPTREAKLAGDRTTRNADALKASQADQAMKPVAVRKTTLANVEVLRNAGLSDHGVVTTIGGGTTAMVPDQVLVRLPNGMETCVSRSDLKG